MNNGYYKITPMIIPNRALHVKDGSSVAGTQVQIWDDNGTTAQQWQIIENGNGSYRLSPRCSPGRIIDLAWGSIANGGDILVWDWLGQSNQSWNLEIAKN